MSDVKGFESSGFGRTVASSLSLCILSLIPTLVQTTAVAEATKSIGSTKIAGRVFDACGQPVAGATVLATFDDDPGLEFHLPTVLTQTASQANGRFALDPIDLDHNRSAEDVLIERQVQLWVWKPGFALSRSTVVRELSKEPFNVFLNKESRLNVTIRNPDGSPCTDATVALKSVQILYDHDADIPRPLQRKLESFCSPTGQATVFGLNGKPAAVEIRSPKFGNHAWILTGQEFPAIELTLHTMKSVELRVVLPAGETADLSQVKVIVETISRIDSKAWGLKEGHWKDKFRIRPKSDGSFSFPCVLDLHNRLRTRAEVPSHMPFLFGPGPGQAENSAAAMQTDASYVSIPLQKAIWVTRVVRDARLKTPLAGVRVAMKLADSQSVVAAGTTNENGQLRLRLIPGHAYRTTCNFPRGYFRIAVTSVGEEIIPVDVNTRELAPLELVKSCELVGSARSASGQPLRDVHVRASWRDAASGGKDQRPSDQVLWATTDANGGFKFESLGFGTNVSLSMFRAGVTLSDSINLVVGDDRAIRLQEKTRKLIALRGRVVDQNHAPLGGVQIAVEVKESPDPSSAFATTTDQAGEFSTPAQFPPELSYRVALRPILETIASTPWMCPATSGERIPEFVIDHGLIDKDRKLVGTEVVALVNGQPIRAEEVLERAFREPLSDDGMNLLYASLELKSGHFEEREYRNLQNLAIRKFIGEFIKYRAATDALLSTLSEEQRDAVEMAAKNMERGYVEKLKSEFRVNTDKELDGMLHVQGIKLANLRRAFRVRILGQQYICCSDQEAATWEDRLAHYRSHHADFAVPERVAWQLLEIEFDAPSKPSKQQTAQGKNRDAKTDVGSDEIGRVELDTRPFELTLGSSSAEKKPDQIDNASFDYSKPVGTVHLRSKAEARKLMDKAFFLLQKREPFTDVVKKLSDDTHAEHDGWQPFANPNSIRDEKTANALRSLREGGMSDVIETDHSFRVVRVVSRLPAGWKAFDEILDKIGETVLHDKQTRAWEDLSRRSSISSPYIDDVSLLFKPDSCNTGSARK